MIRMKTIPAPWPPYASHCCACAMPPAPLSSSCTMSANPSAVTRSAAPFAAPAPCMRWATVICCSPGLLRNFQPIELRFQFRYAASQPPRLLQLDPRTLWFSSTEKPPAAAATTRRKVEKADITQALADVGDKVRYNQLRDQIMNATECSKRTAQLAISEACQQGWIARANGQYHLPL